MASSEGRVTLSQRHSWHGRLFHGVLHGPDLWTGSDYASCKNERRSYIDFCFIVGSRVISWYARRQKCVATSTTETEFDALSEAGKGVLNLWGSWILFGESVATLLFTGSQSRLPLATRDDNSAKTKHFGTRMAYLWETVKNQSIHLKFIASGDNCADIFTKRLGRTKTQQRLARLAIHGFPSTLQGGTDGMVSHGMEPVCRKTVFKIQFVEKWGSNCRFFLETVPM